MAAVTCGLPSAPLHGGQPPLTARASLWAPGPRRTRTASLQRRGQPRGRRAPWPRERAAPEAGQESRGWLCLILLLHPDSDARRFFCRPRPRRSRVPGACRQRSQHQPLRSRWRRPPSPFRRVSRLLTGAQSATASRAFEARTAHLLHRLRRFVCHNWGTSKPRCPARSACTPEPRNGLTLDRVRQQGGSECPTRSSCAQWATAPHSSKGVPSPSPTPILPEPAA